MKHYLKLLFPLFMMADGEGAGGPPVTPPENAGEKTPSGKDTPPSEVDALRAQLEQERAEKQRLADEKKQKEDELEATKLNKLKEQNDWQKIAQEFEGKYNTEKTARENLSRSVVMDKKMTSLREAAIKNGILESALGDLDLLDFPEMKIETTSTGRVKVIGTDSAIQRLKSLRPHWFGKAAPNVNGGSPRVEGGGNQDEGGDVKTLLSLEAAARKSGDWSKVQEWHKVHGVKMRA